MVIKIKEEKNAKKCVCGGGLKGTKQIGKNIHGPPAKYVGCYFFLIVNPRF